MLNQQIEMSKLMAELDEKGSEISYDEWEQLNDKIKKCSKSLVKQELPERIESIQKRYNSVKTMIEVMLNQKQLKALKAGMDKHIEATKAEPDLFEKIDDMKQNKYRGQGCSIA